MDEKSKRIQNYCDSFGVECEGCPVHDADGMEYALCCQCIDFKKMTEEQKDKFLEIFEGGNDLVKHPKHYKTGKFECIDVMEEALGADVVKGFCLGNAFKYLYRCKNKGRELEDVQKAIWYLKHFEELSSMGES